MTVCRFYLKGYCRYGSSCRFEHPGEEGPSTVQGFSFAAALNEVTVAKATPSFSFTQALASSQNQIQQQPVIQSQYQSNILLQHQPQQQIHFQNQFQTSHQFLPQQQPQFLGQPQLPVQQLVNEPNDVDMTEDLKSNNQNKSIHSETELREYRADRFRFRKIPIRPPPKDLC